MHYASRIALDRYKAYMTRIIINTEFDITTLTVAYWLVHFHSVIIINITTLLADSNCENDFVGDY